jgi:predicted nucleotidyltransferase
MKFLHPEFVKVLKALLSSQVEFLLIGGYAVNYHGYGRPTGDLDIWLRPDNGNKMKCINAFRELQYDKDSISDFEKLDFEKTQVFFIGEEPLRIDFLTQVNLLKFEDAWEKKNMLSIAGLSIPVVDYDHLVLTKITTGRTQDKLDLEELQKIKADKRKN